MQPPLDLLGLTSGELIEAARQLLPSGAGVAGKLHALAFATGRLEPEAFGLSAASCRAWRETFTVGLLEVRRTAEEPGEHGATVKAALATRDGHEVECVRIPVPVPSGGTPRATLCVSSQVGCRMGCAFCETGRMGLARNLSAAEIVSQVATARTTLGWDFRNVVFMGMGEPLDNLEALAQALRVLTDMRGLRFPAERLTVCTAGDAEGIRGLRALGMRRLNLSVSLNAADDPTRSRLMPVNRQTDLSKLAAALSAYPQRRTFVLGVNWCLLPGINDARDDARRVAEYCRGLGRVYVNLIPYNPGSRPLCRAPTGAETERFLAWLREEGLEAGPRSARGGSIMAGCGQLGGRGG
jgi:23S rRNA (adenine2503-C2)-methyltransferase